MAELKKCDQCGKPFADEEGWKKKCIVCWKTSANFELTKSDKAYGALQDEFVRTERVIEQSRAAHDTTKEELKNLQEKHEKVKVAYRKVKTALQDARIALADAEARNAGAPPVIQKIEIPPERIKQLIRLVHPDRHGNSELSNEITKWLLSLREK